MADLGRKETREEPFLGKEQAREATFRGEEGGRGGVKLGKRKNSFSGEDDWDHDLSGRGVKGGTGKESFQALRQREWHWKKSLTLKRVIRGSKVEGRGKSRV